MCCGVLGTSLHLVRLLDGLLRRGNSSDQLLANVSVQQTSLILLCVGGWFIYCNG